MKRLTAHELLSIWETCLPYPVIERSLHLLSVLYDSDVNAMARMSIGERDARLLKFREWIFGSKLINVSRCPYCTTPIEWETEIKNIRLQDVIPETPVKVLKLEKDGFKIDFRLPNSLDILGAVADPALAADPSRFIAGCILSVEHGRKDYPVDKLPQKILEKIEQRMSSEDPQADIRMVLSCPDCNKQWEASFDILNYLWLEIDNWAYRLLKEVAILAKTFSWSEKDILNLSYQRRKLYLDIIS
jgi:hypothetical protein